MPVNFDLPSFPAMQAFESTARHLSFTAAADELAVNHSAVSHRIKLLEEFLGIVLFRRETREVSLTTAGRSYLSSISEGLELLAAATQAIRNQQTEGPIHVSTTPVFADRWLIPRVNNFNRHYPDIELHITTSTEVTDFVDDGIDASIRVNHKLCADLYAEPFLELDSPRFPVASPELLSGKPDICQPADLHRYVLLHEENDESWRQWFACAGINDLAGVLSGPRLGYCDLALQAAIEGQGIALAYGPLVEGDLHSGALVRLLDVSLPSNLLYSLVFPKTSLNQPRIAAFRNWLTSLISSNNIETIG